MILIVQPKEEISFKNSEFIYDFTDCFYLEEHFFIEAIVLSYADARITLSHALYSHPDILKFMVVTLNINISICELANIFKGFYYTSYNFNFC